jgi:hypothetical protein
VTLGDPHQPARSSHRKQAIALIEAAHRNGWVTGPDRDLRVGQAGTAQTIGELQALTRDIEWHGYAETSAGPEPQAPPTTWEDTDPGVPGVPGVPGSSGIPPITWILVAAGAVVLVLLGTLLPILRGPTTLEAVGPSADVSGEAPHPQQPHRRAPYSLSARGVHRFVVDYRTKFGRTTVDHVVFSARNVVVDVPRRGSGRSREWTYERGRFAPLGTYQRSRGAGTVDLLEIDLDAFAVNLSGAPKRLRVADPTARYVVVGRNPVTKKPWIEIHLENAQGATGTLYTTLGGRVLDSSTADA